MITTALLVAIAAIILIMLNTRQQYRVTNSDTSQLIKAISAVPKEDVNGADPVVRPPGTTRSYFSLKGRVTTVVYVSKTPIPAEKQATLTALASAGWTQPAVAPPGRVATQVDSFTAVYANKGMLLELAMTSLKNVTAVTYIIQTTG